MKKASGEALREALTVGHFGTDNGPLPLADPLAPTAMVVPVSQIEFYERNPRRAPNHQYESLKESIRLRGVQQPLVITRRPGAPHYIPKHGGNTRLAILKELFAETQDPAFANASCEFHPWTTEADVLIGHLLENELRGDLVFIDKARAIRDAKLLLEEEAGSELTLRQLTEKLRARGYRVSPPILSYCDYAVDVLANALPKALGAGLGKPAIQRLRELDRAASVLWTHHQLGPEPLYRSIFAEAMAAADRVHWDFEEARRSLAQGLAQRAGTEPRHILLEIGAELADLAPADDDDDLVAAGPGEEPPELTSADMHPVSTAFDTSGAHEAAPRLGSPAYDPGGAPAPARRASAATPPAPSPIDKLVKPPAPPRSTPSPAVPPSLAQPSSSTPQPSRTDRELDRLRLALRDRARDYAAHSELAYCLRFEGSPWIRLGYIVADFPAAAQVATLTTDFAAREALAWKWYELTRCCDLLPIAGHIENLYQHDPAAKERVFTELFASGPRYVKAWASPETFLSALSEAVGVMDLQQFSFYAEQVDEDTWQAGMRMLQAYRDLKAYAASRRIDLIQDGLSLPATQGAEPDDDLR